MRKEIRQSQAKKNFLKYLCSNNWIFTVAPFIIHKRFQDVFMADNSGNIYVFHFIHYVEFWNLKLTKSKILNYAPLTSK